MNNPAEHSWTIESEFPFYCTSKLPIIGTTMLNFKFIRFIVSE